MSENLPKVSIVIIHYNTPQFLEGCLDHIFAQSYENLEVIFIDNNSPDRSGLEFVASRYSNKDSLRIIANADNLGYAKAANQGIRESNGEYVVITNPDILYTPGYFATVVDRIEKDSHIASITGKVYKYDFDRHQTTNIIDSVGLFAYKNRRIIDDGQGLIDEGQFDEEKEVFGISGACPLYRREALEDVKIMDEYFDEDFFMYKEDVDLAWRLLLYGWKNLYYPPAIAYHGRGTGVFRRFFNREIIKNRDQLSKFQKSYSFQNQHLMQVKNEMSGTFWRDFFPIIGRKLGMMLYITLKEPYLWKSYISYLKLRGNAQKKRKIIMKNKRITAKEMSKNFKKQSGYLKAGKK